MRGALATSARLGLLLLAGAALAGCDSTLQRELGLRRSTPDEFQVVRKEPLQLPPSFSDLPAPRPGAPSLGESQPSLEARRVLLGDSVAAVSESAPSQGEQALLAQSPVASDPTIRTTLAADDVESRSITNRTFLFIASWQKKTEDVPGEGGLLDPVAEAKRLQGEGVAAQTKPLTVRVGSIPLAAPPAN